MSNQSAEEKPEGSEHSEQQDAYPEPEDPDAGVIFTPIFVTGEKEPSGDFKVELYRNTFPNDVRWSSANNPTRPSEGNPTPFYNDTVEQVYEFWKAEFIDETNYKDTNNNPMAYTKFTFIVIDDQCMQSDPWQIIIGCDAPDYGEADDQVKLKYFRVPFDEAASCLNALEYLTMTPSEAENRSKNVLSSFPPPCMIPIRDEDGEWSGRMRPATREEAIKNKRRVLAANP